MTGLHYEDFRVGAVIEHGLRRTLTEADNVLFCSITMNSQPLHLDFAWSAEHSPYGKPLVNGLLTLALAVGISVRDLTEGTLVANLAYEKVEHPKPVFHGDTIGVRTKVLSKRRTSKPERGLVQVESTATNQRGEVVCTFTRTMLVQVREPDRKEEA